MNFSSNTLHISIKKLLSLVQASIVTTVQANREDEHLTSLSIDTRSISHLLAPHTCFIALPGQSVDGNQYIQHAFDIGVSLCIGTISPSHVKVPLGATYIQVQDSLSALQSVAKQYREQYLKNTIIIGVTGSVGKTTTKDMLTAALSEFNPVSTKGNLNNHIGVPLSILSINPTDSYAVLEAGMNHRGETALLARIMQPDIVVITKIGVAHIEHLKTQEEIAREKSDLALYSVRARDVYIPHEDQFAEYIDSYISEEKHKQISVHSIKVHNNHALQFIPAHTPLHIKSNICLVTTCTEDIYRHEQKKCSIDIIVHNIMNTHITPRRFEVKEIARGITLVDDSYNANPDSMRASLKAFDDICAEKVKTGLLQKSIVILGGMAELGEQSERFHQETYAYIQSLKHIDTVISVGDLAKQYAFPEHILHCADIHIAYEKIIKSILISDTNNTYLFIKGSKSTHMSDLADMLTKYFKDTVK